MSLNPFSTRHTQPGEVPFHFRDDTTVESLIQAAQRKRGTCFLIAGPHGTGKSTLLRCIESSLRKSHESESIESLWLQPGKKPLQHLRQSMASWRYKKILLVDGFEQLPAPMRWIALLQIARYRLLCIATTHRKHIGCRVLWETRIDTGVEKAVVSYLLREYPDEKLEQILTSSFWLDSRSERKSNLRESLFDMYDWWQAR